MVNNSDLKGSFSKTRSEVLVFVNDFCPFLILDFNADNFVFEPAFQCRTLDEIVASECNFILFFSGNLVFCCKELRRREVTNASIDTALLWGKN